MTGVLLHCAYARRCVRPDGGENIAVILAASADGSNLESESPLEKVSNKSRGGGGEMEIQ